MSIICPITNIILRNSTRYPDLYISRCGKIYHSTKWPNKFTILLRNNKYAYLQISRCTENGDQNLVHVHRVVALAWVYNPCPGVFKVLDHLDRDTQNNDASNLRWVTQQLNCLNKKLKKGWEKIVKKNGAVFYRSLICVNGKRHPTYCRTKEDAIECSKTKQKEFFTTIYQKHIDDFASSHDVHERPAHSVCWSDKPVETPEGFTTRDTGFCRYTEGRHAQLMF